MESRGPLAVDPERENLSSVGSIIETCRLSLARSTRKDAQLALKALCAMYNIRVVPAFVPIGSPQATAARVSRVNRNPKSSAFGRDSRIKEVKDKIRNLNLEISKKSQETGSRLPLDDELLAQRNQLFRDLKGNENRNPPSLSKRGNEEK